MKMKNVMSLTYHVKKFNWILCRITSVKVRLKDKFHVFPILSSLYGIWSGTITVVSSSSRTTKLTFKDIFNYILGEDIYKKNVGEFYTGLLNTWDKSKNPIEAHLWILFFKSNVLLGYMLRLVGDWKYSFLEFEKLFGYL